MQCVVANVKVAKSLFNSDTALWLAVVVHRRHAVSAIRGYACGRKSGRRWPGEKNEEN